MIEIKFKCKCMKDEVAVNVRARRANEPLASWMRVMHLPLLKFLLRRLRLYFPQAP